MAVHDWVYEPEQVNPGRPVVVVYRETLGRERVALEHRLKVDIYVSRQGTAEAETEAEDALDEVLLSLQRLEGCTWSEARRVTFSQVFTGYSVDAVMHSTDGYKHQVLAEQRPAPTTK